MSAQEYLKNKINDLIIKYPSIKCSYAFDGFDNTHTIEITPSSFYNHDEFFILDENAIYAEFFQLFPYEGLFFITAENEFPVTNPIYVKSGELFFDYINFVNSPKINTIEIETNTLEPHKFKLPNQLLAYFLLEDINDTMAFQNQLQNDILEKYKSNSNIGINNFALAA